MSQAAVFITCQMPFKSGLPSGVRGSVFAGVCALATETATENRKAIEITVAGAGRRYGMAAVYTPGACAVASAPDRAATASWCVLSKSELSPPLVGPRR